jgi:hypothetical protein
MLDQTAGEIITALRGDEIDLALTVGGADLLSRDRVWLHSPLGIRWLLKSKFQFPS